MIDEQIDEVEYDRIVAAKYQKELLAALERLTAAIKPPPNHSAEIGKIVSKNAAAVEIFLDKLNEIIKPVAPQVSVETNQDEVVKAIEDLRAAINSIKLEPIVKPNVEWRFRVVRGYDQRIEEVIATNSPKK